MRAYFLAGLMALGSVAFAADSETRTTVDSEKFLDAKMNSAEFGFQMSSFNKGTAFTTVAMVHEFESGYALGARGLMPIEFDNDAQVYMGQLFGRAYPMNEENIMFIEGSLAQLFYNQPSGMKHAVSGGLAYGYKRQLTAQLSVGAGFGIEYATARIINGEFASTNYLYNKFDVSGTYYY